MHDLAYLIKVSLGEYSGSSDVSLLSLANLRQEVWAKSHIVGYLLGGPSLTPRDLGYQMESQKGSG